MRPLTDHTPKPLLPVGGRPLIVWHVERLVAAGFRHIVVNHAHLGDQIEGLLGTGDAWGISIDYSPEPPGALETAGGIANALPLLGEADPFLVINGDIFCDWSPTGASAALDAGDLAHLVLVPNPEHNKGGDFELAAGRVLSGQEPAGRGASRHTFAGIGIYHPELFRGLVRGAPAKLAPLLRRAMDEGRVSGELHSGRWTDVGTPDRLRQLDDEIRSL